jgi:mannose-6-phosphate isomerase class I
MPILTHAPKKLPTAVIPNYNKFPEVRVTGFENHYWNGWKAIMDRLKAEMSRIPLARKTVVVEWYQGIDEKEVLNAFSGGLTPVMTVYSGDAFRSESVIRDMTQPDVTNDRIFGRLTNLTMDHFLDLEKKKRVGEKILEQEEGMILIYGPGASLLCPDPTLLVYADMARWEIQLRMRRNEVSNLGISNRDDSMESKYKRGYFVDWRVCDRLKREVMPRSHFILDTNRRNRPAMVTSGAFFGGLRQAVSRPFSVVPYFDAGPWGGQWMKEICNLPPDVPNYAWCFNCVPEENSLYLNFGNGCTGHNVGDQPGMNGPDASARFETPSINLVFFQPENLLGPYVRSRFGDEFPIRFDFLDTMGGGNLSLQVHPLAGYIREQFGIHYTQDESYYLVEAGEGAHVYLGLKENVDPDRMISDLIRAETTGIPFDDTVHVPSWPARKHDHFLIPGGTVHCSGKDCMVLEISATPYIFTFKLWDWGRLGLDGKPRPINIGHGASNIQWNRTEKWVEKNLVNRIEMVARGDGWREEKTGLHELEFIETRRHWFSKKVDHQTGGGVNVLCLVEGREVVVESPAGLFEPFVVHYAETFIIPAAVAAYTISPFGESEGKECVTIKAFIRTEC